jgi:diaminohydroxyphosphoribosylaminopyrimidine deaminase/5-amino-6-(5-phosphoribosylamino)uracil reductase
MLKETGIEVSSGLMATSARALNQGFLSRMERQRPLIRVKLATSMDGRTALANGKSQWITGEAARADVQRLRARSGAIVTGIETVLADDPALTVRLAEVENFQPLRVILDSQLRIPLSAQVLKRSGQVMIVTLPETAHQQTEKVSQFTQLGVQVLALSANSKGRIDLSQLVTYLAKDHQINELLVEAGATLAGAFVAENLADELWWYTATVIMGQEAKAGLITPRFQQMTDIYRWQVKDQRMIGQDQRMILERQ